MKYFVLVAGIILIVQSCNQNKTTKNGGGRKDSGSHSEVLKDTFVSLQRPPMKDSLRNKLIETAMIHGDKDAYSTVANHNLILVPDFLFPSLVMANKYNDPEACFNVYLILCEQGYNGFSLSMGTVDERTKAIGLYYLAKSYELGFKGAKYFVEQEYTDKHLPVPKSSDFLIFK